MEEFFANIPMLNSLLGLKKPDTSAQTLGAITPATAGTGVTTPPIGGGKGGSAGFGMNMDTAKFGLESLQSLANIWAANKAYGLAKDQFQFQKGITNTNLDNSIKSYNTSMEDRARARAVMEGNDVSAANGYIDQNRLTR